METPNNFDIESTQMLSAEEYLARPTDLSTPLGNFGTCDCECPRQQPGERGHTNANVVPTRNYLASWFDRPLTEWIQPQTLRAPEAILGADWDFKVDIWNLGLVVCCSPLSPASGLIG